MKKHLLLIFCSILALSLQGQVFSGWPGPISDDGNENCFSMVVSGLNPAYLDTVFGLERVCIDITHPLATDLDIYLKAPTAAGEPPIYIELSSDNGGTGSNYSNTCFTMFSGNPIASGTAPFTGFFVPEQPLGAANVGILGNAVWELCITDDTMDDVGTLNDWTLEFSNTPAPPFGVIQPVCNVYQTIGCECPDGSDDCDLLPDIMVPALIMQDQNTEYPGYMTVSTGTSNVGYGPLEFIGSGEWYCGATLVTGPEDICLGGDYPEQLVYQRIYQKSSTGAPSQYYEIEAGTMQHHAAEGHDHLHIDSWVENSIRLRGPDPDPSTWPIVVKGEKASFCAMDLLGCNEANQLCVLDGVSLDITTMPNGYLGNGYVCDDYVQGVSVGYSDVYGQNLEGQDIQFGDSLCNGAYYLVTVYDPENIFLESREDNNTTAILVQLGEQNPDCCEARFNIVDQGDGSLLFQDTSVPIAQDWFWDFGDGNTSNLQFPVHTYSGEGPYEVTFTSSTTSGQGCTSTVVKMADLEGVNIQEFLAIQQLGIRPNPFSESATVSFTLAEAAEINVGIFNSLGQNVKSVYKNKHFSKGTHTFEVKDMSAGMFLLKFESGSRSKSYKFIKE